MPEPVQLTVMQEEVQNLAETALNTKEGIAIHFENENYPTPEACKKAASTFRNSFNTMKAKDRRLMRRNGMSKSGYDKLGCFIDQTQTGWQVRIAKGFAAFGNIRVTDLATGEEAEILRL